MPGSAEDLRLKGNECFKEKRYHKAIVCYSSSLAIKYDPVVLSNRSQAYIKIESFEAALADANESLRLDPSSTKTFYRRATSLIGLGMFEHAKGDLKRLLYMDSGNKAAKELLDKIIEEETKSVVPIEYYDKNEYMRSDDTMMDVDIKDRIKPNPAYEVVDSPAAADTDQDDEESADEVAALPSPATTSLDLLTLATSLKNQPARCAAYFCSIPVDWFERLFEAGVEPEFLDALLFGIDPSVPPTNEFLSRLMVLAECPRFDLALAFLDGAAKSRLRLALVVLRASDTASSERVECSRLIEAKYEL